MACGGITPSPTTLDPSSSLTCIIFTYLIKKGYLVPFLKKNTITTVQNINLYFHCSLAITFLFSVALGGHISRFPTLEKFNLINMPFTLILVNFLIKVYNFLPWPKSILPKLSHLGPLEEFFLLGKLRKFSNFKSHLLFIRAMANIISQ